MQNGFWMYGFLKFVFPLMLVFSSGCQTKKKFSDNIVSSEEKEVLAIHRNKFEWLIDKDTAALSNLFHENVSYIHSNGWLENKHEVLQNIISGKLKYQKIEVMAASCVVEGRTAIVTGKGVFYVALENKPIEISLYYTEVYHKYRKSWKLMARHACKI